MEFLSYDEARERLKTPPSVFSALLASGLLGYVEKERVPIVVVEHFEKYGTQWREELGERLKPSAFHEGSSLNIDETPGTVSTLDVAPKGMLDLAKADIAWLAQFYLRPNKFYFPHPGGLALIGPIPLKLSRVMVVKDKELPVEIYPDPQGALAMIMVIGNSAPNRHTYETAYNIVSPILDDLSFIFDQPLPIAQSFIIGIPSGIIKISFTILPKIQNLDQCYWASHKDLRNAMALYREGISSNNPFHSFLTLWKVYENICQIRGDWRRGTKQKDVKVKPEKFPDKFAFGGVVNLTFDQVKQKLNAQYRVAIAHGSLRNGKPRSGASYSDVRAIAVNVPIIRYMARIVLVNFSSTLGINIKE